MSESRQPAVTRSLYWAMLLQFTIGGAVLPFITIYFRDRGLDFSQISRIFFAASSTLLVFPFVWGLLADRFIPLNRLFTCLNLGVLLALGMVSLQQSFAGVLIWYMVFYACFHPTLTLVNALSFHHLSNPSEQFGLLRAWGSLGWILPSLPVYLWLISPWKAHFEFVLYLGMGMALIMIIATFFLPHTEPGAGKKAPMGDAPERMAYWPAMKKLCRDANFVTLMLTFFLVAASFSLLVYYSPAYLEDCGVDRAWIGPIQCFGVLLEVAAFPFLRKIFKHWGYTGPLLLGLLALVIRQWIYAFSENPWLLSLSYVLAGMVIVFYHIPACICINTMASVEVRATAQTMFVVCGSGLGPMFSNWAAGWITRHSGDDLKPVFLFATALAGLAFLTLWVRRSHLNQIHGEDSLGAPVVSSSETP